MTDGGGYDNSSVGYPRGEEEERRRGQHREEKEKDEAEEGGREGAQGATKREETQAERENGERGTGEGRGKEDVCPLAMIIAESHRTWKDRKNDSPSAVFSFAIARRERERARM